MTGRWLATVALIAAFLPQAHATNFFSISGDPNNSYVPDQWSSLTSSPGSVTMIATLGDGSLGFNGGLTQGPGAALYGIANDSLGDSSLYLIQPNGATSLVGTAGGLGSGFLGGLAWDSSTSTLYAAALDTLGNTTLYSITSGGVASSTGLALGTGFSGLAYDSANGLFYGIGNDNTGFSTLYDFSLGGPVSAVGTGLGYGFGALTYDPAANQLWAISPVNNASSQLFQVTAGGAASSAFYTLGDGFDELAVTQGAVGTGVPEPTGALTLAAGLISIAFFLRRRL
jgi:hypothetical protein